MYNIDIEFIIIWYLKGKGNIMFCRNCGKEIKDDAAFCQHCGTAQKSNNDFTGSNQNVGFDTNTSAPVSGTSAKVRGKKHTDIVVVSFFTACIIIFTIVLRAITSGDFSESSKSSTEYAILDMLESPISINSVSYDDDVRGLTFEFENISERDIAYIEFDTYFYDSMGSLLTSDLSDDRFSKLKYTGPFYAGETDSAYWQCWDLPTGVSVIFPKEIKVTFIDDDEEFTFENTEYFNDDNFYGGELKEK